MVDPERDVSRATPAALTAAAEALASPVQTDQGWPRLRGPTGQHGLHERLLDALVEAYELDILAEGPAQRCRGAP